jgi:carboxypeptidase PM20D1
VETEIASPGFDSPLSDHNSDAFKLIERAISEVFPGVYTSPYVMTAASDCRYMRRVSDHCLRFTPFPISNEQMDSIHGVDENVDLSALEGAVDFYRYILTEAQNV